VDKRDILVLQPLHVPDDADYEDDDDEEEDNERKMMMMMMMRRIIMRER
jgi:hypothetical protein